MIAALILIAILGALYMAQPRFRRFTMSSAAFFKELPAPRERRFKFQWSRPEVKRAFWLQLAILLAILSAFLLRERFYTSLRSGDGQGIWVLVDSSASMSTRLSDAPQFERVAAAIREAIDEGEQVPRRFRLSTFDMELRDVPLAEPTLDALLRASDTWAPRPLGTDLQLLRSLPPPPPDGIPVTHLLVISDQAAPDWASRIDSPKVVWRDISEPAPNLGLDHIRGVRNPLTGFVSALRIRITAQGMENEPDNQSYTVQRPDGSRSEHMVKGWTRQDAIWWNEFHIEAPQPGPYQIQLTRGGAYAWDDKAELAVGSGRDLQVDWQLPDRRIPDALGWTQETDAPLFRVVAAGEETSDLIPTLRIATETSRAEGEILDFEEGHPLLRDVNLDAVELLALPTATPPDLRPVLRRADGRSWLATREQPPTCLIPGLPALTFDPDDPYEALQLTLFFNAVRSLLADRPAKPLYTLTDPSNPTVEGNRLALHPGEGDSGKEPRSFGGLGRLEAELPEEKRPFWPMALLIAIGVLATERSLAAWAGPKWRA